MKKIGTILCIVFCLSIFSFQVKATHIMGAEFEWTCVGQDSFLIGLTIYRDCNYQPMTTASIPFKCSTSGSTITTAYIATPPPIDITPTCAASCTRCQSSSCHFPYGIEEYKYTKLVVLSNGGSCCNVRMSYSSCCRTSGITTGGANTNFYTEAELSRCIGTNNSSPKFSNAPITIICIGQDYVFNNGSINSDTNASGQLLDSISYEWTSPLSSSGGNIAYTGQYAYNKPIYFWGFPSVNLPFPRGFHLNQVTGDISFRPMKIEQTTYALKVKEWREINGIMTVIGVTQREMGTIVISCPNNNAPLLSGPYYKEVEAGDYISFSITTYDYDQTDSLFLSWNESIQNANWSSTSGIVKHPIGTLSWVPKWKDISPIPHVFTVTVRDDACPVNGQSTRAYQVLVKPPVLGEIEITNQQCGKYLFDVINTPTGLSYTWYDITQNIQPISLAKSFTHNYPNPGTYIIRLKINNKNISINKYDTIVVTESFINSELPNDTVICSPDSLSLTAHIYNAKGNTSFFWSNEDSTHQTISVFVNSDTIFYFTVSDSSSCSHTDSIKILLDEISLSMSNDVLKCPQDLTSLWANFTADEGNQQSYVWRLSDSQTILSSNPSLKTMEAGMYSCEVEDNHGCKRIDSVEITNSYMPTIDAGPDQDACLGSGMVALKGSPLGGFWTGTAVITSASIFNSSGVNAGSYSLIYAYTYGACTSRDTIIMKVHDLPKLTVATKSGQVKFCSNYPMQELVGTPAGGSWTGPSGSIKFDKFFDPSVVGGIGNVYDLIYHYSDQFTCSNTKTLTVNVKPQPIVTIEKSDTTACYPQDFDIVSSYQNANGIEWYLKSNSGSGIFESNINQTSAVYLPHYNDLNRSYFKLFLRSHHSDAVCASAHDSIRVRIINPHPAFSANNLEGNIPLKVKFVDQSFSNSANIIEWFWDFGDGRTSSQQNPLVTYSKGGYYNVRLRVLTSDDCSSVILKNDFIHAISTTTIQEADNFEIAIFPNPANDYVVVKLKHDALEMQSISLYNSLGQKVQFYTDINDQEFVINSLHDLSGMLHMKIDLSNGESVYAKLIVE